MRKLTLILLGIIMISVVAGGVTLISNSKDVLLDKIKVDKLKEKGIGTIEIYNQTCIEFDENTFECLKIDGKFLGYSQPVISPCKVKDEFTCEFSIFQQGGINKKVIINIEGLSNKEIETKVENKVSEILKSIADTYIKRDNVETFTSKGEEYKIDIK